MNGSNQDNEKMQASKKSTPVTWTDLQLELDQWTAAGKTATFWWRDDDVVEETIQLHRLDALSREMNIPVSVAVIPAQLQKTLPRYLSSRDNFVALQHGYSHTNYAAAEAKKIELGGNRSTDEIHADLSLGREQLVKVLGGQFIPVLVPPWNRIESRIHPGLSEVGFSGFSAMWARKSILLTNGLLQVNTHLDPVNWRQDRGFIGDANALEQLLTQLSSCRLTGDDLTEPTGILTHHLVQTDEVWSFCRTLFEILNRHSAVHWISAREIWQAQN